MMGWRNSNNMIVYHINAYTNLFGLLMDRPSLVWLPIDDVQRRKLMLTEELAYAVTTYRSEKKCYFLRGVFLKVHPWSLEKLFAEII